MNNSRSQTQHRFRQHRPRNDGGPCSPSSWMHVNPDSCQAKCPGYTPDGFKAQSPLYLELAYSRITGTENMMRRVYGSVFVCFLSNKCCFCMYLEHAQRQNRVEQSRHTQRHTHAHAHTHTHTHTHTRTHAETRTHMRLCLWVLARTVRMVRKSCLCIWRACVGFSD